MQAIETRECRGGIEARCLAGRIVVSERATTSRARNHANAARRLAIKLGWTRRYYGTMYGGEIVSNPNGFVFVFVNDNPARNETYCYAPDTEADDG